MHSSRMRTARSLIVSPSMHCSGGGVPGPEGGGLPGPWGCLVPGRVSAPGGAWYQGDPSMHLGRPPNCGQNS